MNARAPRLSASISWMFAELPFLDRVEAAARAGFAGVECHYPYDVPAAEFRRALIAAGMPLLAINTAVQRLGPDDAGAGAVASRETEARYRFEEALAYLLEAGGQAIHVKAGNADPVECKARACFEAHLKESAERASTHDITILIEPLNRAENPRYFLQSNAQAAEIIRAVGTPWLRLMFDLYHMQMDGADILREFRRHRPLIGHVQFAAAPGRHEPSAMGCISLLKEIRRLGYAGWVGAEYRPKGGTEEGLVWMPLLLRADAE